MGSGRSHCAAWLLLLGGIVLTSGLFAAATRNHEPHLSATGEGLVTAGLIVAIILVIVIPWLSICAGWVSALLVPLPYLVATNHAVDEAVRVDPQMNMAGVALVAPCAVYALAFIATVVPTLLRPLRRNHDFP